MMRIALVLLMVSTAALAQPGTAPKLLPLHELVKIIGERFQGRLLRARIDSPAPFEFALGADAVQELTLISPQGNIIIIRIDGASGRVLDVRGRGLTQARVPQKGEE